MDYPEFSRNTSDNSVTIRSADGLSLGSNFQHFCMILYLFKIKGAILISLTIKM